MIIRVQSSFGTKRIECDAGESTVSLLNKVKAAFECENIHLFKGRNRENEVHSLGRKTVSDYGLKHGDMVYMEVRNDLNNQEKVKKEAIVANDVLKAKAVNHLEMSTPNGVTHKEDDVDKIIWKERGLIERPRDDKLCRHGPNGKCVHCTPIEPYDAGYLKEHNIKHMSFHAYLRQMTTGIDKGKFAALENISCRIKPGCKEHLPWPNGICTKCQPNAVTLSRQIYRHVDNLVFENASIVERFLNYWRTTGHQRIGFLYGYYQPHADVPLGIKATVVAIYEPPQESSRDTIKLQFPDKNAQTVDRVAGKLGLSKVGWIFTDLIPDDMQRGTVKNLRNAESHFLSAQECVMAGYFQNIYPNPCRLSPEGYFGSKFVTVCVTGDKNNQVHMEGYQVSNQCMALVRDKCLVPTKDAPELGYVRETSREQYVPDVFFKEKDNFGNEVTKVARPLPIEYLLVDVPVSTPVEPKFTFNSLSHTTSFPVENRMIDGQLQDFGSLSRYLRQFSPDQFLEAVSDFHLLVYAAHMDFLPELREAMDPLLEAIKTRDTRAAREWSRTGHWATLEHLMNENDNRGSPLPPIPPSVGVPGADIPPELVPNPFPDVEALPQATAVPWPCNYCTFENQGTNANCEMCGLPRNAQ